MAEDLAPSPWTFEAAPPVPMPVVPPEHVAAAEDRGPDPLECGFLLAAGILAPLPARPRLPHEDGEGEDPDDDEPALR